MELMDTRASAAELIAKLNADGAVAVRDFVPAEALRALNQELEAQFEAEPVGGELPHLEGVLVEYYGARTKRFCGLAAKVRAVAAQGSAVPVFNRERLTRRRPGRGVGPMQSSQHFVSFMLDPRLEALSQHFLGPNCGGHVLVNTGQAGPGATHSHSARQSAIELHDARKWHGSETTL